MASNGGEWAGYSKAQLREAKKRELHLKMLAAQAAAAEKAPAASSGAAGPSTVKQAATASTTSGTGSAELVDGSASGDGASSGGVVMVQAEKEEESFGMQASLAAKRAYQRRQEEAKRVADIAKQHQGGNGGGGGGYGRSSPGRGGRGSKYAHANARRHTPASPPPAGFLRGRLPPLRPAGGAGPATNDGSGPATAAESTDVASPGAGAGAGVGVGAGVMPPVTSPRQAAPEPVRTSSPVPALAMHRVVNPHSPGFAPAPASAPAPAPAAPAPAPAPAVAAPAPAPAPAAAAARPAAARQGNQLQSLRAAMQQETAVAQEYSPAAPQQPPPVHGSYEQDLFFYLGTPFDADNPPDLKRLFKNVVNYLHDFPSMDLKRPCKPLGKTVLHRVASRGFYDITKLILLTGVPVDVEDPDGITALMEAAGAGHDEVVELLLSYGAHVDHESRANSTPLREAVLHKHEACCKALIEAGANVSYAGPEETGLPLLTHMVAHMPEAAELALDKRVKPICRVKGQLGRTYTSKEWKERVTAQRQNLQQLGSMLTGQDAAEDVQGVVYELDYTKAEDKSGNSPILWSIIEHERFELLEHPWTKNLLEHKWRTFGSSDFYRGTALYMVYLAVFTVAAVLYHSGHRANNFDTWQTGLRIVCDIVVIILALINGVLEIKEIIEVKSKYLENAWNVFDIVQGVLVWTLIITRIFGDSELTVACLFSILAPIFWIKNLHFARSLRTVGPLVHLIGKMVTDILKFMLIFVLFLAGFSHALHLLSPEGHTTLYDSTTSVFVMNLGDFNMGSYTANNDLPAVAVILFVMYSVLSPIVLVNLLIAIMSDTYATYGSSTEAQWRLELALYIIAAQNAMKDKTFARHHHMKKMYVIRQDTSVVGLGKFEDEPAYWQSVVCAPQESKRMHAKLHQDRKLVLRASEREGIAATPTAFPVRKDKRRLSMAQRLLADSELEQLLDNYHIRLDPEDLRTATPSAAAGAGAGAGATN